MPQRGHILAALEPWVCLMTKMLSNAVADLKLALA